MPLPLRRFYAEKLISAKSKEKEALDKSMKKSNSQRFQKSNKLIFINE